MRTAIQCDMQTKFTLKNMLPLKNLSDIQVFEEKIQDTDVTKEFVSTVLVW